MKSTRRGSFSVHRSEKNPRFHRQLDKRRLSPGTSREASGVPSRSGKKVLVAERRASVGGIAATEEIFPGFKYSACAHLASSFSSEVIADLDLKKHGLELRPLDPLLLAPSPNGDSLVIPRDPAKAVEEISRHSKNDANKYPPFCARLKTLSAFLRTLFGLSLPDKANPGNFNPVERSEE